jgi:hypothetical protein
VQQHDVGGGFDHAFVVARGLVDVGNDGVLRVGRVDRNGGVGRDLHVSADIAEAPPLERRHTLQHFEADHLGVGGRGDEQRCAERGDAKRRHRCWTLVGRAGTERAVAFKQRRVP